MGVHPVEVRVTIQTTLSIQIPNLDIPIAIEIQLGGWTSSDAAHHTGLLPDITVLNNLRGSDSHCW
jgi:hypothetical protein